MTVEPFQMLSSAAILNWFTDRGLAIGATIIGFWVLYLVIHWALDRVLKIWCRVHKVDCIKDPRLKTWHQLFVDALRIAVIFFMLMAVLPQVGVNPTTIIAGSFGLLAVFGIAFQQMLQDISGGIVIFFSDRFHVGEEITIAGVRGKVEQVDLRMVILRNKDNEECTIPYRTVATIVNHSRTDK